MNMVQMMFDAIGSMTGGLITDVYTVLLAMLCIGFLCMGFDFIKDAFESHLREKRHESMLLDAENARDQSRAYRGSVRGDLATTRYRRLIRQLDRNDEGC
jgi:hypothetical protein